MLKLSPLALHELVALLAVAGLLLVLCGVERLRRRRHPQSPVVGHITEAGFAQFLQEQNGIDPRIAATVYRYLQEKAAVPVPVLPGDHLIWDLGLAESEVEHMFADLVRRLCPPDRTHPADLTEKLDPGYRLPGTVEDLVLSLQTLAIRQAIGTTRAA